MAFAPKIQHDAHIKDLRLGETAYTVPWAVHTDGVETWIRGDYTKDSRPEGTVSLELQLTLSGTILIGRNHKPFDPRPLSALGKDWDWMRVVGYIGDTITDDPMELSDTDWDAELKELAAGFDTPTPSTELVHVPFRPTQWDDMGRSIELRTAIAAVVAVIVALALVVAELMQGGGLS